MAPSKFKTLCTAKIREFSVVGRGWFPLDMLRRDQCWPADSDSLSRMDDKPEFHDPPEEFFQQYRTVELRGTVDPTEDRWLSFQWRVFANRSDAYIFKKSENAKAPANQPKIHSWKRSSYQPDPEHPRMVVDCTLRDTTTTRDVFWSERCNSYVLAAVDVSKAPSQEWLDRFNWRVADDSGNYFQLVSINGAGEVRWNLAKDRLARILHGLARGEQPGGDEVELLAAAKHFGLDRLTQPAAD